VIASDSIDTASGPLVIQPIRHASLALKWKDLTIFVDPSDHTEAFAALAPPNVILYTHQHDDHFNLSTLEQLADSGTALIVPRVVMNELHGELHDRARLVAGGDVTEFGEVGVAAIVAHNLTPERLKYHPPELGGVGYVLDFAGTRLYISGDTEDTPQMRQLADIDVAFLPMNMPYTMTGAQAADAVMAFRPRIVYPFHYLDGVEHEIFEGLLRQFDGTEVRIRDWYAES
jgi:L-ascorbate metabolism protein UlaG (beta-lactamase superfamily)